MLKQILVLIRPKQYIKNLIIYAPLFFSFHFDAIDKLVSATIVVIIFSLISSSVYIINDIFDVSEDAKHPTKKNRPIASGKITIKLAIALSLLLIVLSFCLSLLFVKQVTYIILIYLLINISYSIWLKHTPVLDIFLISFGFLLRIIAGGSGTGIELSMWILIITFLLALFLAVSKRREDVLLLIEGHKVRKSIDGYSMEFINSILIINASVLIVSYILYSISLDIQHKFGTNKLYITGVFVILGILRYLQIMFIDKISGNPTDILWKDRFLQIVILLWLLTFYLIVKLY
jgi:4-hydroxybenzoate polyprenyltransferase